MNQNELTYLLALNRVLQDGNVINDRTGVGTIKKAVVDMQFDLSDNTLPLLTTKYVNSDNIIKELLWFIKGRTDVSYLKDNGCNIWNEWEMSDGTIGDGYGVQFRNIQHTKDISDKIINYTHQVQHTTSSGIKSPLEQRIYEIWKEFILSSTTDDYYPWQNFDVFKHDFRSIHNYQYVLEFPNDYILTNALNPNYNFIHPENASYQNINYPTIKPQRGGIKSFLTPGKKYKSITITVDQLADALYIIKNDPHNRRNVISLWTPTDLPYMGLHTCHGTVIQFIVEDNKLSLSHYQRSGDMFLGVPYNIASYSILLNIMAALSGYEPMNLYFRIGDAHIYKNHVDQVKTQLERKLYDAPKIKLSDAIIDRYSDHTSFDLIQPNDIEVIDYKSHSKLKAKVAV